MEKQIRAQTKTDRQIKKNMFLRYQYIIRNKIKFKKNNSKRDNNKYKHKKTKEIIKD